MSQDLDSALLAAEFPDQPPVDKWDRYWSTARDHAAEVASFQDVLAPPALPAGAGKSGLDQLMSKKPTATAAPQPSPEAAQVAEAITKSREQYGSSESSGSEVEVGSGALKGISDALTYHPESKTLVVLDAKFSAAGSGPDAAKNAGYFDQLMTYAALALEKYPETKEVALGIARPFSAGGGGTEVKTVSREALERWKKEILDPGVKLASSDDAPFRPGSVCGSCPARPVCPHAKR